MVFYRHSPNTVISVRKTAGLGVRSPVLCVAHRDLLGIRHKSTVLTPPKEEDQRSCGRRQASCDMTLFFFLGCLTRSRLFISHKTVMVHDYINSGVFEDKLLTLRLWFRLLHVLDRVIMFSEGYFLRIKVGRAL